MTITTDRTGLSAKAFALAILLASPGGAALAASLCPPNITTPGTVLELADDLVCPVGVACSCIRVRADNVIVRLNGHSVSGNGGDVNAPPGSPLRTSGVTLLQADNVVIEGPGEISNFVRGVAVTGSSNVGIYGLDINGNHRGIQISGQTVGSPSPVPATDVEIIDTKISHSGQRGVLLTGFTSDVRLDSVEIEDPGISGILLTHSPGQDPPTNTLVQRCEIEDGIVGIHVLHGATNTTVSDCEITGANTGVQVGLTGSSFVATGTKIRDSVIAGHQIGVVVTSASKDTRIRRTCFEDNVAAPDILDNSPDGAVLLDNAFDPPEGCD